MSDDNWSSDLGALLKESAQDAHLYYTTTTANRKLQEQRKRFEDLLARQAQKTLDVAEEVQQRNRTIEEWARKAADLSLKLGERSTQLGERSTQLAERSAKLSIKASEVNLLKTDLNICSGLLTSLLSQRFTEYNLRVAMMAEMIKHMASRLGMGQQEIRNLTVHFLYAARDFNNQDNEGLKKIDDQLRNEVAQWKNSRMKPEDLAASQQALDDVFNQRAEQLSKIVFGNEESIFGVHALGRFTPEQIQAFMKENGDLATFFRLMDTKIYQATSDAKSSAKAETESQEKIRALEEQIKALRAENASQGKEVSSLTRDLAHHMAQSAAFRQQLSQVSPENPLVTDSYLRQRVANAAYEQLARSDFKDWAIVKQVGNTFMDPVDRDRQDGQSY